MHAEFVRDDASDWQEYERDMTVVLKMAEDALRESVNRPLTKREQETIAFVARLNIY